MPTRIEQHGRNTPYAQTSGNALFDLGIELDQAHLGFEDAGRSFEGRRHHAAGAAPCCPDINQNRNVGSAGLPFEHGGIGVERFAAEQHVTALAALARTGGPVGRYTIDRSACGTDNLAAFRQMIDTP